MDVPVTIGIAAAFLGSLSATLQAQDEVYFDSVTMFIFLLLASRYVELMARRKATASLEKMQHGLPASAARMNNFPNSREIEIIPPSLLNVDDIILVKPGEVIPADAEIIEGESAVDVSLLTGESAPLRKNPGDLLPGGAINAYQALVLKVKQSAQESTLSVLLQLIDQAALSKPRLALWADTVASWFVLVLLLFAAAVWIFWHFHDPVRAWPIAIAVLVVSCPCALSLATPTALAAGTDSLLRQGVLIVRGHALETLQRATHIIFDKTGTLTLGRPVLEKIVSLSNISYSGNTKPTPSTNGATLDDYLRIAAMLETSNAHPIAAAITAAARERISSSALTETEDIKLLSYHAGQGISATINGLAYRLGSASFVAGLSGCVTDIDEPGTQTQSGNSPVYLGSENSMAGTF